MLVPCGRESDWIFSTAAGHLQLLLASSASRLVLLGNPPVGDSPLPFCAHRPPSPSTVQHERILQPLLLALSPRSAFEGGKLAKVPFLSYEDGVVWSTVVETAAGPVAGEMLVEDVEVEVAEGALLDSSSSPLLPPAASRERRRRLRFKRMPNLVQTQMRLVLETAATGADSSVFRLETSVLVQPYLAPMVAGLLLASPLIEKKTRASLRPRVLCLGVGGGALLTFLESHLGFDVLGVEADEVVLSTARRHFGLMEGEFLKVMVEDGIKMFQSLSRQERAGKCSSRDACYCTYGRSSWWQEYIDNGIDVIMVDLDSEDARNGVMAPPTAFVKKDILSTANMVLHEQGILVLNVIPTNGCVYDELIGFLREVFSELYEIDAGNGENCVLVATVLPIVMLGNASEGSFVKKLRQMDGEKYTKAIRKI